MGNREQIAKVLGEVYEPGNGAVAHDYEAADAVLASPAIAKLKADTLREAADDLRARANGPALIRAVDRRGGYYGGVWTAMQNEESALRLRADAIEGEKRG